MFYLQKKKNILFPALHKKTQTLPQRVYNKVSIYAHCTLHNRR